MLLSSYFPLDYLRPYLNHSFKNVRERLGSILINIFEADLRFVDASEPECPRINDIIVEVVQKIQILKLDEPKSSGNFICGFCSCSSPSAEKVSIYSCNFLRLDDTATGGTSNETKKTEYDQAVRLFKTSNIHRIASLFIRINLIETFFALHFCTFSVCQWIVGVLNRNTNGNISEYFELLPFACRLERCENDVELAETCTSLLAMLSQGLTLADCMDASLNKIDEVSMLSSWSARLAVIDVLQVLVFNNMPIVLSRDEWVQKVQSIVLRLLGDAILEVRVKAAQVLGGLLHCSFLPSTDKLLELFKQKCRTKVVKNNARRMLTNCSSEATSAASTSKSNNGSNGSAETQEAESVRNRHMGVLGLCAFISAFPYDIPDFVPDVFEHLGNHLNDPQPIPVSIDILPFERTQMFCLL